MKVLISLLATLVLSNSVHAAEKFLEEMTAKALARGDAAAVVKELKQQVSCGNVVAAMELGLMYRDGRGVAVDHVQARKYLTRAAETDLIRLWYKLGLREAQYVLAVMFRDGVGGKADASIAAFWFEEAAELGHVHSQRILAQMYFTGASIKPDPERAFFWSSIASRALDASEKQEMEQIRDAAQKQLEPKRLARATHSVESWKRKVS